MTTSTRLPTTLASPTTNWTRRPEAFNTSWEDRSACYNRPEEWWDGDDPELTEKARTVCVGCPVLAECLGGVMRQERSVTWSRFGVRGGLSGPERVQLFLDQREDGPYDAEEARLLALEARSVARPVSDVVDGEVGMSTVRLAQRLAGEDVPMRKPPSAVEPRSGTAKERAYSKAQDILEWRESGMTIRAIAAHLEMGRETVKDVLKAFEELTRDDSEPGEEEGVDPRLLVEFLSGLDTMMTADQQVLAIADAVQRGMTFPQIDQARKASKGYTASFVSRQRKRYGREGRVFPVQAYSPRVLEDAQVLEMRQRYAQGGITDMDLALQYGVPRNVISHALNGRNYKHVGGPIRSGMSEQGKQTSREWASGHAPASRAAMNQNEMGEAA